MEKCITFYLHQRHPAYKGIFKKKPIPTYTNTNYLSSQKLIGLDPRTPRGTPRPTPRHTTRPYPI